MRHLNRLILHTLFLISLISSGQLVYGQQTGGEHDSGQLKYGQKNNEHQNYSLLTKRIDSFSALGRPKSALTEVAKLYLYAHTHHDIGAEVRADMYVLNFQKAVEAEPLHAIISKLQTRILVSAYPVKQILQSVLAGMYWQYYQQNRGKFWNRSRLEKPSSDFTSWDLQTIVNETSRLYNASLFLERKEQETPLSILNGALQGDKSSRYLRPTLYDLLLNQALDFYLTEEPELVRPRLPFAIADPVYLSPAAKFIGLKIRTTDSSSTGYHAILLLQKAITFHLRTGNGEALAFVDLQRLEYVHRKGNILKQDSLYVAAVKNSVARLSAKPVFAQAQVILGEYYQRLDSLKTAQTYYSEAVKSYPDSKAGINANSALKAIEEKSLMLTVENQQLPGKPVLTLIAYRNMPQAIVQVYKIPGDLLRDFTSRNIVNRDSALLALIDKGRLKAIREINLSLPDTEDLQEHSAEFNLGSFKPGSYALLALPSGSGKINFKKTNLASFQVNALAIIKRKNPEGELQILVLDRQTGIPVSDAFVTVKTNPNYTLNRDKSDLILVNESGYTGKQGILRSKAGALLTMEGLFTTHSIPAHVLDIRVTKGSDTLEIDENSNYRTFSRYDDNRQSRKNILFTDRQVYRPGQLVYFKALALQYKGSESQIMPDSSFIIHLFDANNKELGKIALRTNAFGTANGSFIIPENILNGNLRLSTDDGEISVSVEEYKRSSFQIIFSPVNATYHFGDSVIVRGHVNAYAGNGISQAMVKYTVNRTTESDILNTDMLRRPQLNNQGTVVSTGSALTDSKGNFSIHFLALRDDSEDEHEINNFTVSLEVLDQSGETQMGSQAVLIGNTNIRLITDLPDHLVGAGNLKFPVSLSNLNGDNLSGVLQIAIYPLKQITHSYKNRLWQKPIHFLPADAEFESLFTDYKPPVDLIAIQQGSAGQKKKIPLYSAEIKLSPGLDSALNLQVLKGQPSGAYELVLKARSSAGDTVSLSHTFFNLGTEVSVPEQLTDWVIPMETTIKPASAPGFIMGVDRSISVLVEQFYRDKIISAYRIKLEKGQRRNLFGIPRDGHLTGMQFTMVLDNRLYTLNVPVVIDKSLEKLHLKLLTFRNLVLPGQAESWKLRLTNAQNQPVAGEVLASLYDASLDAIIPAPTWNPDLRYQEPYYPDYFSWDRYDFSREATSSFQFPELLMPAGKEYDFEKLGLGSTYQPIYSFYSTNRLYATANIKIRGLGNENALQETVVVGYSSKLKANLNGIAAGVQVKQAVKYAPITIRKNFNETAFFYPELRPDNTGDVNIDFTMPQALTQWRFRVFAHTKVLITGYLEDTVRTQKELSIAANMTRFLREGDTVTIAARLSNLTKTAIIGLVKIQFFNGLNLHPVQLLTDTSRANQTFALDANSTKAVSFRLYLPKGLDLLTYRIIAESPKSSDGEENTIAVLPNRQLVTESMPMMVRPGQHKQFIFKKLSASHSPTLENKSLTFEYTDNPAWYAVQSMPYLMEFPYECSEQVFSRFYANSLATELVRKMPVIQQVFNRWKAGNSSELLSNLEKSPELKLTLLEESPWLQAALTETEQKKRIALLFDLNKMNNELQVSLDKLQSKQLTDGSFSWFGSDFSDRFISQHILAGLGQLHRQHIADSSVDLHLITGKLLAYLDKKLLEDSPTLPEDSHRLLSGYKGVLLNDQHQGSSKHVYQSNQPKTQSVRGHSSIRIVFDPAEFEIHAWYARSYFQDYKMSPRLKTRYQAYLTQISVNWPHASIFNQAMMALTLARAGKNKIVTQILTSLLETSQQSAELGMYWANNTAGSSWYQSEIETQCLLIELFTEARVETKSVDEMKIWLLRNKQINNWATTKSTAAACYALLMNHNGWLATTNMSMINIGGQNLNLLKPDLAKDAGSGYLKTSWQGAAIKPELASVDIENKGKSISWGAMHWQYLEQLDKITPSGTDIDLTRSYYIIRQTGSDKVAIAVDSTHQPKTGDLLNVIIHLHAGRDYEYVQIKDLRPSGTEPGNELSGYKWQDGLGYYQVTKDAATNFFINELTKGTHVFEYTLRVAHPGNFSSGISSIQCMYAPEFNAHSAGARINFIP